jgi:hypothetical protein
MRRTTILLVALALSTLGALPALSKSTTFIAHLSGANEVPAVETDGQGVAIVRVSGESIRYQLISNHLVAATQAHIHCGAEGVNGPVVAFLFGFVADGVTSNGLLASGTIEAGDVIAVPDNEACPGGVADFDELLAKIAAGETYVNVHTVANPGGEIRGQL